MMMNGSSNGDVHIEFWADSILPEKKLKLQSAILNSHGRLEVVINGETLQFPSEYVMRWCQCEKCFNQFSLSYTNSVLNLFKKDSHLESVSATEDSVTCVSSDGHTGTYTTEWLYNRRLTPEGCRVRAEAIYMHKPVAWISPDEMVVQKATWTEVTETEAGMNKFGTNLIRDGIFVITDSPTDRLIYTEFGEKTGLVPLTNHYGLNFIVENLPTPLNHAYTTVDLDLHVDQPYLAHCPSVQLLHCMVQSPHGGENVMCDGILAALTLKKQHPDYYNLLTTQEIAAEDVLSHSDHQQYYMAYICPTIIVDKKGQPTAVNFNHAAQSSFFPGSVEQYEEYTKALKTFLDILYEHAITIKNQAGDILVFDNQRVMHGRLKYDKRFARKLEGWYLDWDMIHSRLRVSRIKMAKAEHRK